MTLAEQIEKQQREYLDRLIAEFGSKYALAKILETSPQNVQYWDNRGRISATAAKRAEFATAGKITKEDLRPDVLKWG